MPPTELSDLLQGASMSTTFEFRGHTRRIARALVEAMVPRWPDFDLDLTDPVLARLERTLSAQPKAVQVLVVAGLWGLEISAPVFGHGVTLLSVADRDERDRRLSKIAHHPFPTFRQGILLYQTLVNVSAYSMPEVEAYLGANRQEWRADRKRLRDALVVLDAAVGASAVPEALGTHGRLSPAEFLEIGAADRVLAAVAEIQAHNAATAEAPAPTAPDAPAAPSPARSPRRSPPRTPRAPRATTTRRRGE